MLALVAEGLTNAAIADRLVVSVHTVRNHVASVYRKLGVNRRSAVVIWARERGVDGGAGKPVSPGKGSTKLLAE